MTDKCADLLEQFRELPNCRNALRDCLRLDGVAGERGQEFGFDIATDFHTPELDARWVPALIALVKTYGGGQGSKPNSPNVNYLTLQINRAPCGCLYDYTGTNVKLLVWGVDAGPPVIAELISSGTSSNGILGSSMEEGDTHIRQRRLRKGYGLSVAVLHPGIPQAPPNPRGTAHSPPMCRRHPI